MPSEVQRQLKLLHSRLNHVLTKVERHLKRRLGRSMLVLMLLLASVPAWAQGGDDITATPWRHLFTVRSSQPLHTLMSDTTDGSRAAIDVYTSGLVTMSLDEVRQDAPWVISSGVVARINDRVNVMAGVRFRHSYTPQMIFAENAGVDLAAGTGALFQPALDGSITTSTEVALGLKLLNNSRMNLTGLIELLNLIPLSNQSSSAPPAAKVTTRGITGKLRFDFK